MTSQYISMVVLVAATALPVAVALGISRHRSGRGALLLSLLLVAMGAWSAARALELGVSAPEGQHFWAQAELVGAVALPPLWLALALQFTGRGGWLHGRTLALLTLVPVLMLALAWTGPPLEMGIERWAIAACSHVLLLLGAAFVVGTLFGSQRLYRTQSAILLVAGLAPWEASGWELTGLADATRLQVTPFVFLLAAAVLAWGVSRHRLLELVPVDRDFVVERMTDGVVVLDERNRVVDLNPAAERVLGRSSSEVIGQDISRLVSNRTGWVIDGRRDATLLGRYREAGEAYTEVSVGEGPARRHYGLVISRLGAAGDRRARRLLLLRDITEWKLAENRLDRMAHYDPLTSLPNRRLFSDRLNQAIARARRRKGRVALLFLDLDRFKQINDTLGHDIGDLLLEQVAQRLMGCVREIDTVSRLAGDEFVVLLTDVAEARDVATVAQRIVETLAQPYRLKDHEVSVTASVGISLYPSDGQEGTMLLEKGDAGMYRAKTLGRNRFEFYEEDPSVEAHGGGGLGAQMQRGLEKGEFRVYYQPILSVQSGRVFGVEALVRWEHPERGLLMPAEFLPAAEETGLILPIGLALLRESCEQARGWRERRVPDPALAVCVNLSSAQFNHPNLVGDVARILQETGLDPEGLILEISESVVMEDAEFSGMILERLKALGVRIAVDDFGTGYSSLRELQRLPLDILKIDGSLVEGLEADPEKRTLAAAAVSLAHALEITAVAEAVETSRQLAVLRTIGCDLVQGHYLGEALPAEEAAKTLSFIDSYY